MKLLSSQKLCLPCWLLLGAVAALALAGCASETEAPGDDAANPPASDATVFEGARVIVGDESTPIENAVFVVSEGRFTQVGAAGSVSVPDGANRVDLSGKTVMPAIVDTHVHLPIEREALIDALEHKAYYGSGVVMGLGHDTGDAPFQVRSQTPEGMARLLTAGRGITMPEPGRSEVPYWITTEDEARQAVRELAELQVDIVKIWVDDRNGQYEKLSPALYGAVIDEAHQNGLRVTAHIFALEDAKGLLRAGVDAFAHSVRDMDVDEEFLKLIKERPDVVLVPNLGGAGVATDLSWLSGTVPAEQLAEMQASAVDNPQAQERFAIQARNLAALNEAGMKIAFGTDGGAPWAAHGEMADMVAAGMSPAEVIVAATSTSAEFVRLDGELGTIETGKSADFLVLDANPLDDIANTQQISDVYLRGSALDRAALRERWNPSSTESQ